MYIEDPRCLRCGIAFEGVGPSHLCGECLTAPPPFERAAAAFRYGGAAKDAVLRLKYGRVYWIGSSLGRKLALTAEQLKPIDVVIPIPLHPKRLRARGFNQSALIAKPVARALGCPMETRLLHRVRDTVPQAGLAKPARAQNIRGAFLVQRPHRVRQMRVVLVDDVITTGETMKEAARVLLEAGAVSVVALAAARAC